MNKYYKIGFDKRLGGTFVRIYDEEFNSVEVIKAKQMTNGTYTYRETELPIDFSGMEQVVNNTDTMFSVYKTEPINDRWYKVVEMPDYTSDQLEAMSSKIE